MRITRKAYGEKKQDRIILGQQDGAVGWYGEFGQFRMHGLGQHGPTESEFTVEISPSEFLQMLDSFAKNQSNPAVKAQISAMVAYIKEILESDPYPPAE